MKPAWDSLAKEYENSDTIVIVDVDCTADKSKELCSKYGVRGYPTIKYFTGSTDPLGDKYEGGRTLDDLKKFASENLGPSCSPDNLDLCSDDQKAEIEKFMQMSDDDLAALETEKSGAIDDAEKTFKSEVEQLQKTYEKLMEAKDKAIADASPDLRVIRSVAAAKKKAASSDGKDEL